MKKLSGMQQRVLTAIWQHGPVTDEGLCNLLSIDGSTLRPRRGELARLGLIAVSPAMGVVRSGRHASRWCVTDTGRQVLLPDLAGDKAESLLT